MIEFVILGECVSSKNSREIVHFAKKLALVKSKRAQAFEKSTLLQIPATARQQLTGRCRITVHAYYPRELPDLDLELLYDCLQNQYKRVKGPLSKTADGEYTYGEGKRVVVQKGVVVNDRQFREKLAYHHISKSDPRCMIQIEPLDPQQDEIPLEVDEIPGETDLLDAQPF